MIFANQIRATLRTLRRLVPKTTRRDIVCFGDSLTAGTYPHYLAMRTGTKVENHGSGGQTSFQIADRVRTYPKEKLANKIVVLWMGRNDYKSSDVIPNIQSCVDHIGHDRVLVLTVINGDYPDEDYGAMARLNEEIRRYNHLDMVKVFDGTLPPPHLRADEIHLNRHGYRLVGNAVADAIEARNW